MKNYWKSRDVLRDCLNVMDFTHSSCSSNETSREKCKVVVKDLPLPIVENVEISVEDRGNLNYEKKDSDRMKKLGRERDKDCGFRDSLAKNYQLDMCRLFKKTRTGGNNIVNIVRNTSGNSYLAKKQRLLQMSKKKDSGVLKKTLDRRCESACETKKNIKYCIFD